VSTSPVSLDFSKSQPITEAQPAPGAGNISLDFSKAQPLAGPDEQHTAGDVADASPIMRPEQMQAAAGTAAGLEGGRLLGKGAVAGGAKVVNNALSYLGLGAKAAEAAPAAKEVATGLLDAHGQPIMRAVAAAEPEIQSTLQKILSHPAVQAGLKEAGKDILKATGFGAGYEVLHHLL
jgi:hypothetical protein